jgi:ABC-2 type transport system permease protein
MAGVNSLALTQIAAIALVRWRIFNNRLSARRAKFEVALRLVGFAFLLVFALAPSVGIALASYFAVMTQRTSLLVGLCWMVFLAWQFLPTLLIALTETWDTTLLLRFPLSPLTYSVVRIFTGSLDPASFVAALWLLAIFIGVTFAIPALAAWTALVLGSFAIASLLLSQLLAAWLSRWLAQRRTREIIGALVMLVAIGNQFIATLVARYMPQFSQSPSIERLSRISRFLPPGQAALAIADMGGRHRLAGFGSLALLYAYVIAFAILLAIRLRAEYAGENLSEAPRGEQAATSETVLWPGIEGMGASHSVSAVFDKELRALFRSPQLVATMLLVPPLALVVFGKFGASETLRRSADLSLAFGLANAVLSLTRVLYNNFGIDKDGVQLYFIAPVRMRRVVIGKNLAHATILLLQTLLVTLAVVLLFGVPALASLLFTLAALVFAAAVNFSMGNLFSFWFPRKDDFAFNRQRGSAATGFAALGIQFAVIAIAAPLYLLAHRSSAPWVGATSFSLLSAIAIATYFAVLARVDRLAMKRREALFAELCRTT